MPNLTQDPAQLEPTNKHCTSTKMLKGKTIPKSKKKRGKAKIFARILYENIS
jgi:hypothetical protein